MRTVDLRDANERLRNEVTGWRRAEDVMAKTADALEKANRGPPTLPCRQLGDVRALRQGMASEAL